MNKIFKLIWNKSLGQMVVVSENAKSVGKTDNTTGAVVSSEVLTTDSGYRILGLQTLVLSISTIIGAHAWAGNICDLNGGDDGGSTATGVDANACGVGNVASGYYSSALGYSNTASGYSSSALGFLNTASDAYSSALGYSNTASGYSSSALGYGNKALDTYSSALGYKNTASGQLSSALGYANTASGFVSSALGYRNNASGFDSSALGYSNTASQSNSIALGGINTASGFGSVAVGSGFYQNGSGYVNGVLYVNDMKVKTTATKIEDLSITNITAINDNTDLTDAMKQVFIDYVQSNRNTASGLAASAVGVVNNASGDGSSAVGFKNRASATNSSAFGSYSSATAKNATAIGYNSLADEANTVSVGRSGAEKRITNVATATNGTDAVNLTQVQSLLSNAAIGTSDNYAQKDINANALGSASGTAYNSQSNGTQLTSVAGVTVTATTTNIDDITSFTLPNGTVVTDPTQVAAFKNAVKKGGNIALAVASNAVGSKNLALGNNSNSVGSNNTAIGDSSSALGRSNIASGYSSNALGSQNTVTGIYSTGVGFNNNVTQEQSAAVGISNTVSGKWSNAVGTYNKATGIASFAAGSQNLAKGSGSTVVGAASGQNYNAENDGTKLTAINGIKVEATDLTTASITKIGDTSVNAQQAADFETTLRNGGSVAFGDRSAAVGSHNIALGVQSSAVGYDNQALGVNSTSLGVSNKAIGGVSTAVGANNTASAIYSSVFGSNSNAIAYGSTAIGHDSLADEANTISVGKAGVEKRITNVAVATKDTDAVNYTQLKDTNAVVATKASQTDLTTGLALKTDKTTFDALNSQVNNATSGLATKASTTALTTGLANTLTDAKTYADTGLALKADQTALTTGLSNTLINAKAYTDQETASTLTTAKGYTDQQATTLDGKIATSANTINTRIDGIDTRVTTNTNEIATLKTNTGHLAASAVVYDNPVKDSITLAGTSGTKLTNLKDATLSTSSTDAVTGKQLNTTNSNVTTLGNRVTTEVGTLNTRIDGEVTTLNTRIGNEVTTLDSKITTNKNAITALDGRVTTNEADIATLQQGQGALNQLAVQYDTATKDSISLKGANGTKLTNLQEGDISSASSKDAITGGQLYTTNQNITTLSNQFNSNASQLASVLGGGAGFSNGTFALPTFNIQGASYSNIGATFGAVNNELTALKGSVSNLKNYVDQQDAQTLADANTYTDTQSSGTLANAKNYIDQQDAKNLNDAKTYTDQQAITTLNNAKNYTDQQSASTLDTAKSYTDQKVADAGQYISIGGNGAGASTGSNATGKNSTAIGPNTVVTGNNSTAVGVGNTVSGNGSGAFGDPNTVSGNGSYVVGNDNTVKGDNTFVLGNNVNTEAKNAVVLGNDSTSDRDNTVSVGSSTNQRQITHVAAGTADTDAVNVAQMKQSNTEMLSSANSYTDTRFAGLESTFRDYSLQTERRFQEVDKRFDRQGAMSAAMMNMATSTAGLRGQNRIGVGAGLQGAEQAVAVGYQRMINENTSLSISGALSKEESSGGVGVGFSW